MDFLIVTGLSGAGKSRAADVLEDLDYYCVDNLPVALMPKFAELCIATGGRYEKVALVTDVRAKNGFDELLKTLDQLKEMNCACRILYMDADVPTIVRRYKETRRPHPLAKRGGSIEEAVYREIDLLAPIRERADFIVNSSELTLGQLQSRLFELIAPAGSKRQLEVTVEAFGFKHGVPQDADLVFDVRFLPNPYYLEELRPLTGLDRPVAQYVFDSVEARTFMEKMEDLLDFLLPLYVEEGKLSLLIAVGCTGGRHRSVAIAAALTEYLKAKDVNAENINRDIKK
ncbi:MAG: RNase adapter RapZ [Oscillospiraceae bacterium]|nr:RNase adapter RapZ [Oscillospiraceae bacterium]